MRTRIAVAVLAVLFVAPMFLSGCVRKARMTGTFDGEWDGQTSDEITIEGDGPGTLILESDENIWNDELEGEITGAHKFEIDDSTNGADYEGEGEVRNGGELELDIEDLTRRRAGTFEGEKE